MLSISLDFSSYFCKDTSCTQKFQNCYSQIAQCVRAGYVLYRALVLYLSKSVTTHVCQKSILDKFVCVYELLEVPTS